MPDTLRWSEMSERERDTLVATHVFGWKPIPCPEQGESWDDAQLNYNETYRYWYCCHCLIGENAYTGEAVEDVWPLIQHQPTNPPLAYTTDMNAAWQVVERFGAAEVRKWPNVRRYEDKPYSCSIATHGQTFSEWGKTPAEAICLAALRAVGVTIE